MAYTVEFTETFNGPSASNGWTFASDHDHVTYPSMASWVDTSAPDPSIGGSVLFFWTDGGPWTRSIWHEKIYSGFAPGSRVGVHLHTSWALDTGPGSAFVSIEGGNGTNPVVYAPNSTAYSFWVIPLTFPGVVDNVLQGIADINGEVKIKYGAMDYAPSSNLVISFAGVIEIVKFLPTWTYGYIMQHHNIR